MIHYTKGNLLEADVEALVNTVNTVGVMGKGIALQFKQAFPQNFKEYKKSCDQKLLKPGDMLTVSVSMIQNPKYIINFPTKRHWKNKSKIEDVESGLVALAQEISDLGIKSIAVPPLGCGNGGLNWKDVKPLIEKHLEKLKDVDIHVYEPGGAPKQDEMKIGTTKPNMTKSRALFISAINEYMAPGYKLSLLEIQKIGYFLQELGEPLRLDYKKYIYGPYAENLNHVLLRIEGHYIRGYGDRSKDAEIYLLPGAVEEANSFLSEDPVGQETLKKVSELIRGFETPYGMELLSTVHWLIKEDKDLINSPETVVKKVQSWNSRKKRLFRNDHIIAVINHLQNIEPNVNV
ncbi:Appr-1-p processing protein [Bacillus idriensis]|uniref:Appr-1-p processing protein n=1 Tax=Metabacillus idriensis TaxID=324768 RepID=A0A6I2MJJ9_9BACI|nr:macro domain-containing protein [Metabacillus idriensis]MRX56731.1 Appr-1-p processing protein [Metabacillus idriensis]